jgi:hypothetical protein
MEHDFTESELPSGLPPAAQTGEPRVDEVLRMLDRLRDLPVSEHPGVFEQVHGQLVDVLGELRSGQDGGPDRHRAG